jgi:hypothetical protein
VVTSSVLQLVSELVRVFRGSNQSKIQRWCTKNGIGSSALRWEELPNVVETDDCVPSWKGTDPLGRCGEHNLCSSDYLPFSKIEGHVRRQQQGDRLLVSCSVSIRIRSGSNRGQAETSNMQLKSILNKTIRKEARIGQRSWMQHYGHIKRRSKHQ